MADNPSPRPARVGISTHEAALTSAVTDRAQDVLFVDGNGYTLVVLEEVELGLGRPDILLLGVDLQALSIRRSAGLRLRNLTEARALGAMLSGDDASSGSSYRHFMRSSRGLRAAGWTDPQVGSRVVGNSLLIEAKVTDWGKGVHQLTRVRWASHSAALLVPARIAMRVPPAMLLSNSLGLITKSDCGVQWERESPRLDLPPHVDAWLGELVIRTLEA